MQYKVKLPNETLDSIIFKHYGKSFGYLELALQANTFLYEQPIFLREGIVIELPEVQTKAQERIKLV